MIRRDIGRDWLLISQVDHARLAGELATAWGNDAVAPLPRPDLLVPALRGHDDGWRDWERSPEVDPATGRPREFTEMPMAVSTAIWIRSIEACARGGLSAAAAAECRAAPSPLAGLWVSRHFCWLAEKARDHRRDRPEELAAVEAFLGDQAVRQEQWQRDAVRWVPADELDILVETGFRFVQFFDRLSLWLCCAERSIAEEAEIPGNGPLRMTPLGRGEVALAPFPLSADRLELSVPARRIAARQYADDADLHAALAHSRPERLNWVLVG